MTKIKIRPISRRNGKLNSVARRQLARVAKDIEAGKNLSPAFSNARDAIAYLRSQ
jgi:hypothetical protein